MVVEGWAIDERLAHILYTAVLYTVIRHRRAQTGKKPLIGVIRHEICMKLTPQGQKRDPTLACRRTPMGMCRKISTGRGWW